MSFVRQHSGTLLWSGALHVAAVVALSMSFRLPARPRIAAVAAPIQGVIVDESILERAADRRTQDQRRERQRVQREERERREAAVQQREAERRVRDEAANQERLRVAADKREREREASEQRDREAAAKREREAAEQRRRGQQAENELQDALAAEREQADAVAAGLLDQYMLLIENRVRQFWNRPLSARPGIDCVVNVTQQLTGDVIDARVGSCNGDEAVRRSIEKAVRDASPLPRAPSSAVFSRTFSIRFQPDE